MNRGIGWLIFSAACFVALLFLMSAYCARAAEGHTHEGAVGKFYQSWMMPDNRGVSCCHDQDCAPAASRLVNGKWEAERDGEWVQIPDQKVETERDSPDGRSHLCGKRYSAFGNGGVAVFCFVPGAGI